MYVKAKTQLKKSAESKRLNQTGSSSQTIVFVLTKFES